MDPLPATERRASGPALDLLEPAGLAALFAAQDRRAVEAVARAGREVARAIELAAEALGGGGRLILLGAGTSGRLAVIEAAECLPTFSNDRVIGLMAGGPGAFLRAREGAEDDRAQGRADLAALEPGPADLVLGVSASGRTPWVLGALEAARGAGAPAALLACAPPPPAEAAPLALVLLLDTGPEALSGSTRLKAGTATKCALNAITTGAMARLGAVMDDLMVDVAATNAKLRARAERIVAALVPAEPARARALLEAAGGQAKPAVVMGRLGVDAATARARLATTGGHLRRALGEGAG